MSEFDLRRKLLGWTPSAEIIEIDGITQGAACTVLCAKHLVNNDDPLMIANSDQYVDIAIDRYLADMDQRHLDGLMMTMQASDKKWSFAALDAEGLVTRVAEKQPISTHATVGIYNFRRGADFVRFAETMIRKELRVNDEFYVAPVYNEAISAGSRVGVFDIGAEAAGMYGLGVPADLELFLSLDVSLRATNGLASR